MEIQALVQCFSILFFLYGKNHDNDKESEPDVPNEETQDIELAHY